VHCSAGISCFISSVEKDSSKSVLSSFVVDSEDNTLCNILEILEEISDLLVSDVVLKSSDLDNILFVGVDYIKK